MTPKGVIPIKLGQNKCHSAAVNVDAQKITVTISSEIGVAVHDFQTWKTSENRLNWKTVVRNGLE